MLSFLNLFLLNEWNNLFYYHKLWYRLNTQRIKCFYIFLYLYILYFIFADAREITETKMTKTELESLEHPLKAEIPTNFVLMQLFRIDEKPRKIVKMI